MSKLLTTAEAAERLGVSVPRVRQLILENRLPAQKLGRDLFVDEMDLKLVEDRKIGRPRKTEAAKSKNERKAVKRGG